MTRLRGRAPRGERLIDKTPHGHWKTTTLIAALDLEGMRCSTVVDGAVNGDVFEAFVEQVLVPDLRPGDVVIMDNLSSHKRQRIREMIEKVGARLVFLPAYSPDLNPIELIFAKVKQLLRSRACRTLSLSCRATFVSRKLTCGTGLTYRVRRPAHYWQWPQPLQCPHLAHPVPSACHQDAQ